MFREKFKIYRIKKALKTDFLTVEHVFMPGKVFYCRMLLKIVMHEVVCPKCEGKTSVKKGIRKTRFEMVQRYLCKHCSIYFGVLLFYKKHLY